MLKKKFFFVIFFLNIFFTNYNYKNWIIFLVLCFFLTVEMLIFFFFPLFIFIFFISFFLFLHFPPLFFPKLFIPLWVNRNQLNHSTPLLLQRDQGGNGRWASLNRSRRWTDAEEDRRSSPLLQRDEKADGRPKNEQLLSFSLCVNSAVISEP